MHQKMTALQRYAARPERANKRVRKAALKEAKEILADVVRAQERRLANLRRELAKNQYEIAEQLRGPAKYGLDTRRKVYIAEYQEKLPKEPEDGFRFIVLRGYYLQAGEFGSYADNESSGFYIWHGDQWVKISGDIMRDISNGPLRMAWVSACRSQLVNDSGVRESEFVAPGRNYRITTWDQPQGRYGEGSV